MPSAVRKTPAPVRNFREFNKYYRLKKRLRNRLRDQAVFLASLLRSIPQDSSWIRFPYYHHVFEDERKGFASQLGYMRNFGEFISMDDAVSLLESVDPLDGRYFCVTFDDGYKNCFTNALPILLDNEATAIFFIPTELIDLSSETGAGIAREFYPGEAAVLEFLTWRECRRLADAGMAIGSHTVSHARLSDLSETAVERELKESKAVIERELGRPCSHFSPPGGKPDADFITGRDPRIAREVGYRSFSSSRRGSAYRRQDPMMIERDLTLAGWDNYQLRYFYSL
jgi:peptidoglycan/xylan/chitin deacetylase (PgdA/CDA1 family)